MIKFFILFVIYSGMISKFDNDCNILYIYWALAGNLRENKGTCTISCKVLIIPHRYYKDPDLNYYIKNQQNPTSRD